MMVILVCQIAGSIAGFVYYKDIKGITQTNLMESINSYKNPNREGVKIVWDKAQMDVSLWYTPLIKPFSCPHGVCTLCRPS